MISSLKETAINRPLFEPGDGLRRRRRESLPGHLCRSGAAGHPPRVQHGRTDLAGPPRRLFRLHPGRVLAHRGGVPRQGHHGLRRPRPLGAGRRPRHRGKESLPAQPGHPYGDRSHGPRPDYVGELSRILQRTFDRGGNVVIPSFAVGRTQELLYFIREIKKEGLVTGHGNFPVYIDSPLAIEATRIFKDTDPDCFDEDTRALLAQGIDDSLQQGNGDIASHINTVHTHVVLPVLTDRTSFYSVPASQFADHKPIPKLQSAGR